MLLTNKEKSPLAPYLYKHGKEDDAETGRHEDGFLVFRHVYSSGQQVHQREGDCATEPTICLENKDHACP